jgi:hypothetical protein
MISFPHAGPHAARHEVLPWEVPARDDEPSHQLDRAADHRDYLDARGGHHLLEGPRDRATDEYVEVERCQALRAAGLSKRPELHELPPCFVTVFDVHDEQLRRNVEDGGDLIAPDRDAESHALNLVLPKGKRDASARVRQMKRERPEVGSIRCGMQHGGPSVRRS